MLVGMRGSSPLTRGKPHGTNGHRPTQGDHPRSRGENINTVWNIVSTVGSSPLTRGKQRLDRGRADHERIIPAHAGKTPRPRTPHARQADHPRSRGENINDAPHAVPVEGSSPLTRGKRKVSRPTSQARGIIPAHAGKTGYRFVRRFHHRDHPRSRGENSEARIHTRSFEGSSPLTRGKLERTVARLLL